LDNVAKRDDIGFKIQKTLMGIAADLGRLCERANRTNRRKGKRNQRETENGKEKETGERDPPLL
jgi:hypothetical protein